MSSVILSGDTSGSVTLSVPAVAGSNTITFPASTGTAVVAGQNSAITSGTAVTCAGQTSIDFTSIPSWVKRITVVFSGVSTSGTNIPIIQIGAGSFIATGYAGSSAYVGGTTVQAANSTGFLINGQNAAGYTYYGEAVLLNISGNTWVFSSNTSRGDSTYASAVGNGSLALSGTLDRVRVTTVGGTDIFDTVPLAGTVNIMYE